MLALIAGRGALPAAVAGARATRPLVAVMQGCAPDGLDVDPDLVWRLETLGTLLARLKSRGVDELCLCGAIDRPVVDVAAIDEATLPLVPFLREALQQAGDDGALRAVMSLLEAQGFVLRAAHEVAPDLLPPEGVLSEAQLPPEAADEAMLGDQISAEQGAQDLGQACVLREGAVLAREDARGTDAMLAGLVAATPANSASGDPISDSVSRAMDEVSSLLGQAADWLSGIDPCVARSGMFYKAPKPGQDRRADLPVIGPETVTAVARAGLAGITITAGGVMVLDRAQCLALCDQYGLYFWVRHP